MKLDAHGGDLLAMASVSKRDPASLLDFSVNVRPEGAPEFLRAALVRANTGLAAYPSHADTACPPAASPSATEATSSSTPSPAYSKGAAHPAFPSSNRRSANTRWPAALPGWKAARSGAASVPVRTGSLPAICWPGLPKRPRVRRCFWPIPATLRGCSARPENACPCWRRGPTWWTD